MEGQVSKSLARSVSLSFRAQELPEGQQGVSMSHRDRPSQPEGERERAIHRLYAAVAEQSRLRDEGKAAKDAPEEAKAKSSLRAADHQVAARERWLKSVDDHDY